MNSQPSTLVYLGLGANLGNAQATLLQAAADVAGLSAVSAFQLSPLYRTAPVDSAGPDYINAVAALRTSLPAKDLLRALQQIEDRYGRERPYRNAPRTLDLDVLLYGSQAINEADLTVPHPRMHERAFVLKPLSDLDPDLVLPQGPISRLLAACSDQELRAL